MRKFFIILLVAFSPVVFSSGEDEKLATIEAMIEENGIDTVMEQLILYEQKQYPMQKDNLDIVTSVFYIKVTRAKVYTHTLTPGWAKIVSDMTKFSEVDAKKFMPELMKDQSVNTVCSNKLNKIYLKHGVKIVHRYSEQNGTELFTTEVKNHDCKA